MSTLFLLLSAQAILGAVDNFWHHELQAKLPQRPSARRELALHALREAIYALLFAGLAWFEWHGAFASALAALLLAEVVITLADFLEEDRTRRLPPFERVLHTVLALGYGGFIGLFAPLLLDWSRQPNALVAVSHGGFSAFFTLCAVGVGTWSVRNMLAVRRLRRAARAAAQPGIRPASHPLAPAVLVTGATGFVGRALVGELQREGRRVVVLSRDAARARALFDPAVWVVERLDAIPGETRIDAVVNLAGARVLGLPWTRARRQRLLMSRTTVTAEVVALMRRLQQRPRVLVSASAVGYYGASPTAALFDPCTEASPPRPGEFQSDLCVAIEHEARRAEALGVRVVRLRLGVVLGRGDGAYPMLAASARLGLGAVLGTGRQPAPWIHLDDAVGLVRFALAQERLAGPINAVAPDVPPQAGFVQALAGSFGRRVRLRMPAAPLRALLGEMTTLLLDGQNAPPRAALAAGYGFRFPTLSSALAELARK